MTTDEVTHRHQLAGPIGYGYERTDEDGGPELIPTATYAVTCEALEPWHDPNVDLFDLTVEEGATWVTCPNCREEIRVDL